MKKFITKENMKDFIETFKVGSLLVGSSFLFVIMLNYAVKYLYMGEWWYSIAPLMIVSYLIGLAIKIDSED